MALGHVGVYYAHTFNAGIKCQHLIPTFQDHQFTNARQLNTNKQEYPCLLEIPYLKDTKREETVSGR